MSLNCRCEWVPQDEEPEFEVNIILNLNAPQFRYAPPGIRERKRRGATWSWFRDMVDCINKTNNQRLGHFAPERLLCTGFDFQLQPDGNYHGKLYFSNYIPLVSIIPKYRTTNVVSSYTIKRVKTYHTRMFKNLIVGPLIENPLIERKKHVTPEPSRVDS